MSCLRGRCRTRRALAAVAIVASTLGVRAELPEAFWVALLDKLHAAKGT